MTWKNRSVTFLLLSLIAVGVSAQQSKTLLGIKLQPEIATLADEIEKKAGKKIYAEFTQQEDYVLASSFINEEDGRPIVLVDPRFEGDDKKLPAIIAHELLHLGLRVNDFPVFLFSPEVKTARGRAIDTEQGNINDLRDLIEHRAFRDVMNKLGLYDSIDIAGDTLKNAAARKGKQETNADAVNYARAILEYQDLSDIKQVADQFKKNGWTRALKIGAELADIITNSVVKSPRDAEITFIRCLIKLYPSLSLGNTYSLKPDPAIKHFRQMIVSTGKAGARKAGK